MLALFRLFVISIVAISCGACDSGSPQASESGLPIATVSIRANDDAKPVHISAEVASTSPQRQKGLMLREKMDENRGMLFLFPGDTRGGFWMKDTLIPLDIAYVASDGTVVDIKKGVPKSTSLLVPSAPYRYVVEVNEGWFARHGLGVGSKVELPPGLPAAQ